MRDLEDVTALAQDNGLTLVKIIDMPSNNLVLAFERRYDQT